jgi:hypothetical protein
LNIIEAIKDPAIIGDDISAAQETYLRVLYGLPLTTDEQLEIFEKATGLRYYQPSEFRESTAICGRRSGKSSKLAANTAIFESCFRKHELAPGEKGWVTVLSATRRQASIVFDYILSRLENSPTLRRMIDGEPRADEVDLINGISIGVWPSSYRSVRGLSIVCAICDEIAFWFDDASSANPASEVLRAIRPGMANFPQAKLLKISSPHAKEGLLWTDWRDREKHPEMLVWKLGTREMNPALSREFLDAEALRDPESFEREYNASFYESAAMFLSAEAVDAAIVPGRFELPPQPGVYYTAALDAAFRGDNFAFAIAHRSGEKVIQDLLRSWRGSRSNPVNLAAVIEEIAATLHRYGAAKIHGDSFCSEPIRQALRAKGIIYEQVATLGSRAAPVWNTLRTLIASGQVELLEDAQTVAELKRLELIVTGGGNQRVEAASGHDDRCVALALCAHQAVAEGARIEPWFTVLGDEDPDERFFALPRRASFAR